MTFSLHFNFCTHHNLCIKDIKKHKYEFHMTNNENRVVDTSMKSYDQTLRFGVGNMENEMRNIKIN